jgi:hypothetical protein
VASAVVAAAALFVQQVPQPKGDLTMLRSSTCLLIAAVAFVAALAGCGGDSFQRTHVSGKVTYKNAPVAEGFITFIPDDSKKAQGNAPIKDGAFDTRQGKSPSPGPVVVRIEGFDGKSNPDQPAGNPIFFHEERAELPNENITKEFIVPANAPKTPPEARTKQIIVP